MDNVYYVNDVLRSYHPSNVRDLLKVNNEYMHALTINKFK